MQEKRNAHRVFVRKLFGRTSFELENNIKCDLKEARWWLWIGAYGLGQGK